MKDWLLHHLHFVIAMDLLLHAAIIALCILALYWSFRFIKAVKSHPNTTPTSNFISHAMLPIVGIMIYSAIHSAALCFVQYHVWWNR